MFGNLFCCLFLFIMCLVGCFASSSSVASENEASDTQGELRRACSLSDLSKPSPRRLLPSPPNNGIYFTFIFVHVGLWMFEIIVSFPFLCWSTNKYLRLSYCKKRGPFVLLHCQRCKVINLCCRKWNNSRNGMVVTDKSPLSKTGLMLSTL